MERRGSCLEGCCWDKTLGQVRALGGSIALPIRATAGAETRGRQSAARLLPSRGSASSGPLMTPRGLQG